MGEDEAHRRIRELEAELAATRRLFRLHDVPTLTLDDRGTIVSTNGKWFGQASPDCVGRPLWELFHTDCRDSLERGAASGWIGVTAQHLQLESGRDVALSVVESAPGSWLVAIRDISRRRLLDEAIDLRHQLQVQSDLAGAVARELADPLSVVQARLELLEKLEARGDAPPNPHVAVAHEHARKLSTRLRNLREIGRASAMRHEAVDLSTALESAFGLLGDKQKQVLIDVEHELTVGGETQLVARVLAKLIGVSLEGAGRSNVFVRARDHRSGVIVEVGPSGRPRGEPDAGRTGLGLETNLLHGSGGELLAWRRTNDRHFEARFPLPPMLPKAKRSLGQDLLLVGSERFHEAVQHVLDMDGFDFLCVSGPSDALALLEGRPEVHLVGIELIQPRHGNGIEVAEGMVARHPELAGGVLVAGPRLTELQGDLVGVSWPINRREWIDVARRRARR